MAHDQNKKTLRSFQCRDYLWDIFEQMSGELECSVDYLINEAMRQYARSRNYGVRSPSSPGMSRPPPPPPQAPSAPPPPPRQGGHPGIPSLGQPPSQRPSIPSAPPPPPPQRGPAPSPAYGGYQQPPPQAPPPQYGQPPQPAYAQPRPPSYPPAPPQQQHGAPPPGYPQPPPQAPPQAPPPQYGGGSAPPPLPRAPQAGPPQPQYQQPQAAARPTLFVIFNGQKMPVAKDEFVIGRGAKTADLPIKDGNISRRHAAVVFQNGAFFMKDLGSTNGVEYGGARVDTKQIAEGDIFHICDYELRFTYQ
jgi:hypothetical protein